MGDTFPRAGTGGGWPREAPQPDDQPKICIYPGCERPAVPPHPMGGPQPAFCDLEQHNALSAHLERKRLAEAASKEEGHDGE
jgi:hypothetical protein